jgi:hypothetical protein
LVIGGPQFDTLPGREHRRWQGDCRALAEGPVAKKEIEEAAEGNGIAERTLFRAKTELGVIAKKSGLNAGWTWELPQMQNWRI